MEVGICGASCEVEKDMSLIETFYEDCTLQIKTSEADGVGGTINTWTDGKVFPAAFPSLTPAQQIAAQQATAQYTDTIVTQEVLQERDIFKRISGAYYQVIAIEAATPKVSTFKFNRYDVKKLEVLP